MNVADIHERRSAAVPYLLIPLPLLLIQAVCWAYLVTGNGGQDVSEMASLVEMARRVTPWTPSDGIIVGPMLAYLLYVLVCLGLVTRATRSSSTHVGAHAKTALVYCVFMLPLLIQLPYVFGATAALPVNGFSVVEGMVVVGGNPHGTIARFLSGIAFSGVIVVLPLGSLWRSNLNGARDGRAPATFERRHRNTMIGAGLIGLFVFISAFLNPV